MAMVQKYDDFTRRTERADERQRLRPFLRQYLEGRGINPDRNFRCLNPAHDDRNPSAFYTTGHRVKCRSCGAEYDIFDLMALDMGKQSPDRAVFDEVRRRYGQGLFLSPAAGSSTAAPKPPEPSRPAEKPADYTRYFIECAARIHETDYPQRRGLTAETCRRFMLGYDAQWTNPKNGVYKSPHLIIPTSRNTYTARKLTDNGKRYQNVGRAMLFMPDNVKNAGACCIVTEGALDAISVLQLGGNACALSSADNVQMFLDYVTKIRPPRPLYLMLDNDNSGRAAQTKLADGLWKIGVQFAFGCGSGIPDGLKDVNDMLMKCPDRLKKLIEVLKK